MDVENDNMDNTEEHSECGPVYGAQSTNMQFSVVTVNSVEAGRSHWLTHQNTTFS